MCINANAIKEVNKLFYSFLWNGKGDRIKRNVIINDYPDGGLKMIDIGQVVPFGRKHRYVAMPDRGPGTGTNYEKGKWNTTFRSEIPTGKTGPPF